MRIRVALALVLLFIGIAVAQQSNVIGPVPPAGLFTVNGALKGNGSGTITQGACADLSDGTTNCSAAVGQLPGTATNDSAAAGKVGQIITSSIASGSAVSLSTNAAKTITSIPLTAGDWDVFGVIGMTGGATTAVKDIGGSISSADNTRGGLGAESLITFGTAGLVIFAENNYTAALPTLQVSLSGNTTYYLVGYGNFTISTMSGYGVITARRRR